MPYHPWGYETYRYWYLGGYVKLMMLTILLNPVLSAIGRFKKRSIIAIFFAFVSLSYLSKIWLPWESHSPRTIIFVYVLVRLLLLLGLKEFLGKHAKARRCVLLLLLVSFGLIVANASYGLGFRSGNYYNPLTISAGILLVASFANFSLKGSWVRVCEIIAPSMIAVYMIHWNFMETVFKPVPQMLVSYIPGCPIVAAFVFCALLVFVLCAWLDLMRRYVANRLMLLVPESISRYI